MPEKSPGEHRVAELSAQVLDLQRRMRRYTAVLLVGGLVVAATFMPRLTVQAKGASSDEDIFTARGIFLVDKDGKTRGMWGVTEDGDAMFALNDGKENPRLVLLVDARGHTEVSMVDGDGGSRSAWVAAPSGESEFAIFDVKGTPRLGLKVNQHASALLLNDSGGVQRALLSVGGVGRVRKAELGFYDRQAKRRLAILTGTDGTPGIVFVDPANPGGTLGGWCTNRGEVQRLPKGNLLDALSR